MFFIEVRDYIPVIKEQFESCSQIGKERDAVEELHRLFHNIKGAASQLYLNKLSASACIVELLLEDLLCGSGKISFDILSFLNSVTDRIEQYCLNGVRNDQEEQELFDDTVRECTQLLSSLSFDEYPTLRSYLMKNSSPLNDLLDQQSEVTSTNDNAQKSIRSIINLLGQLNQICMKSDSPDVAKEVVMEIHHSVLTLLDCTGSSASKDQFRFLKKLDELLESVAYTSLVGSSELTDLLGELLSYLEILFISPAKIKAGFIDSIIEKIEVITSLLISEEKEPSFSSANLGEDISHKDIKNFLSNEDDLFLSPVDDFLEQDADAGIDFLENNESGDYLEQFFPDDEKGEFEENFFSEDDETLFADPTEPFNALEDEADEADEEDLTGDDTSLEEIFREECEEHLISISQSFQILEANGTEEQKVDSRLKEALREIRRAIHTLKGAAAMTGFSYLSSLAHRSEDLLDYLFEETLILTPDAVALLNAVISTLEDLSRQPAVDHDDGVEKIKERISTFLSSRKDESTADVETVEQVDTEDSAAEANEPIETVAALTATDSIRVRVDRLEELVNLEGDLVISRNTVSNLLDDLNTLVTEVETTKEKLKKISQQLEAGFEVQALQGFGSGGSATGLADMNADQNSEFDVMELDRYSELNLIIRSLNETSIDVTSLHSQMEQIAGDIRGQLANQSITMGIMQDRFMRIRMTPLSSISRMFYRVVSDTALKVGKKVRLLIDGEDIYLDRFVWSKITDPIMHILRNAIDHGIEKQEERIALEKSAIANITINTMQRGNMVVLRISDDGQGVDLLKLHQKLIGLGLVDPSEKMEKHDLLPFLFSTGISTSDTISQVSGRGVGLDVVQKNIQSLKGYIHVFTEKNKGTTFELNVPISLSVNRAVTVFEGGRQFAIPWYDIQEVVRADIKMDGSERYAQWRGERINVKHLSDLLGVTTEEDSGNNLAIIVRCGETYMAVIVNTIASQQEIVVKSLGSHLKSVRGINGVTDFGDGHLIPILNLPELLLQPADIEHSTEQPKSNQGPLRILVVDDSISVRQSISRLLKNQDWIVETAKDGLDALERLEELTPNLIVSDIEMPRMNGYEFKEALNNDPWLQEIPVIMLTSRISEKHQQKALELGVQRYLIKPYQEETFINIIKELAGN